ncbi:ribosomal protein L32 [Colletotrichum truncatum]|uniref:Ribosomal protein L32 n=1 Tax=Colletotrichum truncatum TaxID=5467 RepID=A0ACC3YRC0_COLTU|nr:ribosomal protein L32 [Colletotrichum truncatum]KAF6799167.1 ribosomal protein L32 [Colletotrichum truncatum]
MATSSTLTLTVQLPPNQYHSSAKTLLGLPRELRNQIYNAVLVTPPKYSLSHKSECHFRHNHTRTSIEPAAYMVLDSNVEISGPRLNSWIEPVQCQCAKRPGLNLLLASRQIHREAAPLFWQKNEFVFITPDEFTNCVGSRLRQEYRALLRNVNIASLEAWNMDVKTTRNVLTDEYMPPTPRWHQFWGVMKQCKGMRRLAVRPEVLRKCTNDVARLRTLLPELRKLEMTFIGKYKDRTAAYARDYVNIRSSPEVQRHIMFVRAAQEVDLEAFKPTAQACKELYRNFTTNFCVHVDRVVKERFLGCWDMENVDLHGGSVLASLNDSCPEYDVELPTGQTVKICFEGVPQSKETRIRIGREKMIRDSKLRRMGKPNPGEEKALAEGRRRREEKKEEAVLEEARERERELETRRRKEDDRRDAERKERELEREELARAAELAREERKAGRKRAGRIIVETDGPKVETEDVVPPEPVKMTEFKKEKAKKNEKKGKGKKGMGRRKGVSEIEDDWEVDRHFDSWLDY